MKEKISLLPHRKEYCLLIKSAFTADFCDQMVAEKKETFKKAITHYPTSYRNNERQVTDNEQLSTQLFAEIKNYIPKVIEVEGISDAERGTWQLAHLNSRIRICRYLPEQYFHKHLDGIHFVAEDEQSKLTFMIYLNGYEEFAGGKTLFFNSKEDDTVIGVYKPEKGDLIIFDHNLWHSGELVTSGEKYILRSDIIYRRLGGGLKKSTEFCGEGHLGYIWTATVWNDRLLTSGRDKKIKIWSKAGEKIGELSGHDSSVLSVIAFDKKIMLSASRDQTIKIWTELDGRELGIANSVKYHDGAVLTLCKMDAQSFLSGGADGVLNRITISGERVATLQVHDEWIWGIAKITSKYFTTISEDGSLKIWDMEELEMVASWQGAVPMNSIAVEGLRIFVGRLDGSILIYDFEKGTKSLRQIFEKKCHTGIIRKLLVTEHGLYSASEDNTAKKWEKDTLELLATFQHKNFVQDLVVFSGVLISVSYDGTIRRNLSKR